MWPRPPHALPPAPHAPSCRFYCPPFGMPLFASYDLPDPDMGATTPAPTLVMVKNYPVRGHRGALLWATPRAS